MVFERSSKGILGKILWCFKGVSWKFQGFSKKVFRVLQGTFKGVSRKFQGCFKKDWSGFQRCLKEVQWASEETFKGFSRMFQGCFKDVSKKFQNTPTLPTQTQCQQYLSCYWPAFDETVEVGSWEHLQKISIDKTLKVGSFDANCHDDICQGNICTDNSNISNISAVTDSILTI